MKRRRILSDAAWSLLQRLQEECAVLAECKEPLCFRFHIVSDGVCGDAVHSMTMSALAASGMIREARMDNALYYKVSDKGYQGLGRRRLEQAFSSTSWHGDEAAERTYSHQEADELTLAS